MKRAIMTLSLTGFITGTMLFISQSSAIKLENAKEKVIVSKHENYQNLKDSINQFNNESDNKIGKYEKRIIEPK